MYSNNLEEQYAYIDAAKNKGYNVLLMDGQLDVAMVSMLEHKLEKCRFTRVDSDVVDRLIAKDEPKGEELAAEKKDILSSVFRSQLPSMNKVEFHVEAQAMGENGAPIMITQSEYMRRMKEMSQIQSGMSFYGEMPDMFNLVLNSDHKLVKQVLEDANSACADELLPIETSLATLNFEQNQIQKKQEGKKYDEITQAERDELSAVEKKIADEKSKKDAVLGKYAGGNKVIRQLVDLALLQNNMLKGEALTNFVKRSIEMI